VSQIKDALPLDDKIEKQRFHVQTTQKADTIQQRREDMAGIVLFSAWMIRSEADLSVLFKSLHH
jgi:hypothetical protein